MPVLLSIIIPTYNRANLIEKTIASVLGQSEKNFEVIVIDDGSTDNTEEVVSKYLSDQFRYIKIENGERGAARNHGTKLANGKYINWFDSDDIMHPNHVETIAQCVGQYQEKDLFILNFDNFFPEGNFYKDNATAWSKKLGDLKKWAVKEISVIPPDRRKLERTLRRQKRPHLSSRHGGRTRDLRSTRTRPRACAPR